MAKKTVVRIPRPRLTKIERQRNQTLKKMDQLHKCIHRSLDLADELDDRFDELSILITDQQELANG